MSTLRQATKDIKSLSDALARTTFERQHVAERRLLLQRGDGPALSAILSCSPFLLEACSEDLRRCTDLFVKALIQAASNSSSFDQWWAAWVTSPVSTRLLHAMQTLMDGCIFQVKGMGYVSEVGSCHTVSTVHTLFQVPTYGTWRIYVVFRWQLSHGHPTTWSHCGSCPG